MRYRKVAVLMGGISEEREISLKSGKAVENALKKKDLEVVGIDVGEDINRVLKETAPDIAFIALHGKLGEDGGIQRILEGLRIPYTGSGAMASTLCMDKIASKKIFSSMGIPTPRYHIFNGERYLPSPPRFPVIVKPSKQGSTIGVSVVRKQYELPRAVEKASKYEGKVFMEEFIEGREITVGILGEDTLPVIEIIPKNPIYDYEAKYCKGKTDFVVPARLPGSVYHQAQEIALEAHKALGCEGFSRVDMIVGSGGTPYVLEINSIPGLTELSNFPRAAQEKGISFPELCVKLLDLAWQKGQL